jgi:ATP/maltotriose-dependent transcriptional regulator MalT
VLGTLAREAARAGDDALAAHVAYMRSVAASSLGDAAGAGSYAERAEHAAARCGSPTARAQAAYARGVACERDDPERALRLLRDSVALAEEAGNRWLRTFARTEELAVLAARGEVDVAVQGWPEVVETWFRGGDWANQWLSLRHVFAIFVHRGLDEVAATLHAAIDAAGAATALPFEPVEADRLAATVGVLRERLGAAFDGAVSRGRAMRDEEIVAMTLEHLEALRAGVRGDPGARS